MEFLRSSMNRSGVLRFSPFAYAKLIYWRDIGQTEIGCYAIMGTSDPLLITDLKMIKQTCSSVSVDFDKEDSIKFVEEMTDKGLSPWQHSSCFIHTHPGDSPSPSQADEENFRDNFSIANCSIFYILAKGGKDYTRMRFNVPPGIDVDIRTQIDYSLPFKASDHEAWKKEYDDKVTEKKFEIIPGDLGFGYGLKKSYNNIFSSTFVDREESSYIFEEDDKILFWVEEVNEYYEYDKELERFYDEEGKRIKHGIKPEWEQAILEFLTKKEMENEYVDIIGGENLSSERISAFGEIEED